jgi:hypothetical protein
MLERVGEALLDHPVGSIGSRGSKTVGGTGEAAADGQSRRGRPRHQFADQPHAVGAAVLPGGVEQIEQTAYLRLGLLGHLADRVERLGRQRWVGGGQPLAGACLDHHHADAVRHDVVQLAGDPGSLIADCLGREQRALGLKLAAADGELLGQSTARPGDETDRPRSDREHEKDRVERGQAVPYLQADDEQEQGGQRSPLIGGGPQGVGQQEDRHRDQVAEAVRNAGKRPQGRDREKDTRRDGRQLRVGASRDQAAEGTDRSARFQQVVRAMQQTGDGHGQHQEGAEPERQQQVGAPATRDTRKALRSAHSRPPAAA